MKISIRSISLIYLALLLLLGSSIAKAEQTEKETDSKLLCKYTEVDSKVKPPKRRILTRECAEQENLVISRRLLNIF